MPSSLKSSETGLRRQFRAVLRFTKWLWRDWRKNPGLVGYSRRQSRLNQIFFESGEAAYLNSYVPVEGLPKTLWIYWAQGEEAAPPIVRYCIDSWRRLNPDWDVRVLDTQTAGALVDLSDVPDFLPRRFQADVLRLRLIATFGGVWTDATTLCHRPLDDWLSLQAASGFFVFTDPGPDRWLANWFIAAAPGHRLIVDWEKAYSSYITKVDRQPGAYFMTTYTFQWHVRNNAGAQAAWARCARLPAPPTFLLMSAIKGHVPMSAAKEMIVRGLPVSKLSWKAGLEPDELDRLLVQTPD